MSSMHMVFQLELEDFPRSPSGLKHEDSVVQHLKMILEG